MRKINLLSFSLLILSLACLSGEKDWPPKLDKELTKLTTEFSIDAELKKMDVLIDKWKKTGDKTELGRVEKAIVKLLVKGDITEWTMEDFKRRVKEEDKLKVLRNKMYPGHPYFSHLWGRWISWASYAKTRVDFFNRLVYGFKNKKAIQLHSSSGRQFKQAVYKFMENNLKMFPGKKERILFCQQLIAAGVRDREIRKMPSEISKE